MPRIVDRGCRVGLGYPFVAGHWLGGLSKLGRGTGVDRFFRHSQRRVVRNRLDNRLLDDRGLDHGLCRRLGGRDDSDSRRRRSWRRCPGGFFRRRWSDRAQCSAGRGWLRLGSRNLGRRFGWQWRDGDCRDRAFRLNRLSCHRGPVHSAR